MTDIKRHEKLFTFFTGTLLILVYFALINERNFVGDAGDYWLSAEKYNLAKFDLLNYDSSIRGYLFPLILYFIQRTAIVLGVDGAVVYWFAVSVFFSFSLLVAFPDIMSRFMGSITFYGKIIFLLLSMYLFKGMFIYPLTDLWALCFLICAIWCMMKVEQCRIGGALWLLMAGLLFGTAYYFRPVYLASLIIAAILVIIYMIRMKKWYMPVFFAGVMLMAIPQMMINHHNFNTWSPVVQTQIFYGENKSLYLKQLEWGMIYQKCEVSLDTEHYQGIGMYYPEDMGIKLLERDGMDGFDTYWEYIRFCIRHLADVCTIYLKHLFNGIDIVYNEIYIYKVYRNRFFIQLLNYSLIFVGITGFLHNYRQWWNRKQVGWILCWFAPVVLAVPTAIETRFFVGLLMVIYYMTICSFLKEKRKLFTFRLAIKYAMFILACFVLNNAAFSTVGIPIW